MFKDSFDGISTCFVGDCVAEHFEDLRSRFLLLLRRSCNCAICVIVLALDVSVGPVTEIVGSSTSISTSSSSNVSNRCLLSRVSSSFSSTGSVPMPSSFDSTNISSEKVSESDLGRCVFKCSALPPSAVSAALFPLLIFSLQLGKAEFRRLFNKLT
ncbi:hypothetical protein GQX74_007678 [Glossina fuscipes]|nr:hypothetical protein GQX74_007678 [Glossina fuscipes]